MQKIYVLDTSVLIHDPESFKSFPSSTVVIPITVLEELDKLKKGFTDVARNARVAVKLLDDISSRGEIGAGISIENNIILKIDPKEYEGIGLDKGYGDSKILACAVALNKKKNVTVVSRDFNLRIRSRVSGLLAEGYDTKSSQDYELYTGFKEIKNENLGKLLLASGYIDGEALKDLNLLDNEFVFFLNDDGSYISTGQKITESNMDKITLIEKTYPWDLNCRNREQMAGVDLIMNPNIDLVTLVGKAGSGKAQPIDADILTPTGWKKMGDMKIGDIVCTPDGGSTNIINIFPQGKLDIYKISFSDGSFTECCEDHLWLTKSSLERDRHAIGKIRTTKDIKSSLLYRNKKNHSIPITNPIQMPKKTLVLDPYAFGCLIGDGTFRHHLGISSGDEYIIKSLKDSLNKIGLTIHKRATYDYNIIGISGSIKNYNNVIASKNGNIIKLYNNIDEVIADGHSKHTVYKALSSGRSTMGIEWTYGKHVSSCALRNYLIQNNLWMKKTIDKYIPNDYKYSSIEDRIALLQGLMDTDGSVDKHGKHFEFTTISNKLMEDFKWIIQSLGGTVTISSRKTKYVHNNEIKLGQLHYRIVFRLPNEINPFRLPRKKNKVKHRTKYYPRRYITNVEFVGKKEAQCILINSKDHLYLTNDCIVTHNTLITLASSLELVLNQKKYNKLVIYRPIQPMGNELGFTPGSIEEKLGPWFEAVMDNFEILLDSGNGDAWKRDLEMYTKKGKIEMNALTYIRGRSISNALIFIDESQNLSKEEIKTILTRAGNGSKVILTGDIEQIDNNHLDAMNNGLTYVINKFKGTGIYGHITLTQGERSRLATLSSKIL